MAPPSSETEWTGGKARWRSRGITSSPSYHSVLGNTAWLWDRENLVTCRCHRLDLVSWAPASREIKLLFLREWEGFLSPCGILGVSWVADSY